MYLLIVRFWNLSHLMCIRSCYKALGSYDLSDPKNPWIADRKRSTKSPIVTLPLDTQVLSRPSSFHTFYTFYTFYIFLLDLKSKKWSSILEIF